VLRRLGYGLAVSSTSLGDHLALGDDGETAREARTAAIYALALHDVAKKLTAALAQDPKPPENA
jgi:hypothetical protein